MRTQSTKQIRSRAFVLANSLYLKSNFDRSTALRMGWQISRLEAHLKNGGEAIIRFRKVGEEIPEQRHATGLEGRFTSKGTGRHLNPLQIPFFDLTKNAVRSFRAENLFGWTAAA